MSAYSQKTSVYKARTPQPVSTKVDEKQVKNQQGFYVFQTEAWNQLSRFLIMGTTAPTYHAGTKNIDKNVRVLEKLVKEDAVRVINTVLLYDQQGRLIKKQPAIFVIAYVLTSAEDLVARKDAVYVASQVIRTGRDISSLVEEIVALKGGTFSRLSRQAVAYWYNMPVDRLAYQVVKYRNTGQFSHRNVLRLAHPVPRTEEHVPVFKYLTGKLTGGEGEMPQVIYTFELLNRMANEGRLDEKVLCNTIRNERLTHEMVPTQFKNSPKVWEVLAEDMPFTATVWNLSTFSRLGLLKEFSDFERMILARLRNKEQIEKSRIHPFKLLVAIRNYEKGSGFRNTWNVNNRVVEALEEALYISLQNVENTGTRYGLVVDTSGSMTMGNVIGSDIQPIEVAGAMAAINCRQGDAVVLGVNNHITKLPITKSSGIADVVRMIRNCGGYTTNLGLGIEYFLNNRIKVDCLIYYTDNEINQGRHPVQLFDKYKSTVNQDAKIVCVAMTANDFTIFPDGRGDVLNIAGFDANAPQVIEEFVKGF